jgi:hypothetical protein
MNSAPETFEECVNDEYHENALNKGKKTRTKFARRRFLFSSSMAVKVLINFSREKWPQLPKLRPQLWSLETTL